LGGGGDGERWGFRKSARTQTHLPRPNLTVKVDGYGGKRKQTKLFESTFKKKKGDSILRNGWTTTVAL